VVAVLVLWPPPPETALVVENRLTEAIALTVDDTALRVAPGDSARVPVDRGRPLEAHWAMVQPTSPQGRPLGGPVEGTFAVDRARGEIRRVVYAGEMGEGWLAPVVRNRSGRALTVLVVAEGDTIDCGCVVPPGQAMNLGYYRAAGGTAVLVSDTAGWSARLGALEAMRDSLTGLATLEVDSTMLRPPSPRAPHGRAAPAPAARPLQAVLPAP
jgi:hypothetical protein